MPDVVALDEFPQTEPGEEDFDELSGKVPCPECGELFKSRGLTRHLTQSHGVENPNKRSGSKPTKTDTLALRWAEFQRGSALFVSFACSQCAAVLVEDATHDGEAIAQFCATRPKLKKQIEQVLGGMDVMILVGALGETARKMLAHHSLGKQLGLGPGPAHSAQHGAAEKMMDFMTGLDPDARHQLLDQVFASREAAAQANATVDVSTPVTTTVTTDNTEETPPGMPPQPQAPMTEQDRYAMAVANSQTGEWSQT
jgi:hypothetical protein